MLLRPLLEHDADGEVDGGLGDAADRALGDADRALADAPSTRTMVRYHHPSAPVAPDVVVASRGLRRHHAGATVSALTATRGDAVRSTPSTGHVRVGGSRPQSHSRGDAEGDIVAAAAALHWLRTDGVERAPGPSASGSSHHAATPSPSPSLSRWCACTGGRSVAPDRAAPGSGGSVPWWWCVAPLVSSLGGVVATQQAGVGWHDALAWSTVASCMCAAGVVCILSWLRASRGPRMCCIRRCRTRMVAVVPIRGDESVPHGLPLQAAVRGGTGREQAAGTGTNGIGDTTLGEQVQDSRGTGSPCHDLDWAVEVEFRRAQQDMDGDPASLRRDSPSKHGPCGTASSRADSDAMSGATPAPAAPTPSHPPGPHLHSALQRWAPHDVAGPEIRVHASAPHGWAARQIDQASWASDRSDGRRVHPVHAATSSSGVHPSPVDASTGTASPTSGTSTPAPTNERPTVARRGNAPAEDGDVNAHVRSPDQSGARLLERAIAVKRRFSVPALRMALAFVVADVLAMALMLLSKCVAGPESVSGDVRWTLPVGCVLVGVVVHVCVIVHACWFWPLIVAGS